MNVLKEINPEYSLEGLMLKLEAPVFWPPDAKSWLIRCWKRLKAGREGDDRGRDAWMASLTQWILIWASSGRWWRTGKRGMLQSMGSQSQTQLTSEQQYMNRPMWPTLSRIWISNHHFKKDFWAFYYIHNIIIVNMLYMG